MNRFYIGFDFSINKPAAVICHDGHLYYYFWPRDLSEKHVNTYKECNVRIISRGLPPVNKKAIESSQLVLIHTIRSTDLANLILKDVDDFIKEHSKGNKIELYIATEGLSYSSKGDATLNLATYKGVLLSKIYEHYGDSLKRLFTYSPMTMKRLAGCSSKEYQGEKRPMIKAFLKEPLNSPFKTAIIDGTLTRQKNYVDGVDDLVDAYWAFKTMVNENHYDVTVKD